MKRILNILALEDNALHAAFLADTLHLQARVRKFSVASTGTEFITALKEACDKDDDLRPNLLFLDNYIPDMTGLEVLAYVRSQSAYSSTPVIFFSVSQQAADIYRAYQQYASCYIIKPSTVEEYKTVIGVICDYWTGIAAFPIQGV